MLAPVALFVYNRLEHTLKTIRALSQNELASDTELFIFSDGPKNDESKVQINILRNSLKENPDLKKFKNVTFDFKPKNYGLSNSIIDGVSKLMIDYGKVIVIEDDILTSKNTLKFLNDSLEYYFNKNDIWAIGAYNIPIKIPKSYKHDVFKSYRTNSWGWASWKNRWDKIDWNLEDYDHFINSKDRIKKFKMGGSDLMKMLQLQRKGLIQAWDVVWCYNQAKYNSFTIYPTKTKVKNIGFDGSGYHNAISKKYDVTFDKKSQTYNLSYPEVNARVQKNFIEFFNKRSFIIRIKTLIKKILE